MMNPTLIEQLRMQLVEVFAVNSITMAKQPPDAIIFRGQLLMDSEKAFAHVRPRFEPLGYTPTFTRERDEDVIKALPGLVQVRDSNPRINLLLFVLTVASTIYVGGEHLEGFRWFDGILYAATLLTILGAHEFGHYFMARYYQAPVTLPYFIPMPIGLGTMGAFIRLKAPFVTRKSIFDVGLAGPIAGLIFAVPLIFIGLALSDVKSFVEINAELARLKQLFPDTLVGVSQEGNSIFYAVAKFLVFGKFLPNGVEDVWLSPVASAAWLGLLVTSLNLLPAGQLDGGHVAYAMLGEQARYLSWASIVGLLALTAGLFIFRLNYPGWLLWAGLIYWIGIGHPAPLNELAPLGTPRKIIGVLSWVLFIVLFTPIPFS
jgi:membrane-associated protease RseP (regulator of RpoE activity)